MVSSAQTKQTIKTGGLGRRLSICCLPRDYIGIFLFSIILPCLWVSAAQAEEVHSKVVVITNKDVQEKSITLGALRSIFGMRLRSWAGGKPVRVFVFSDYYPVHIEFSKKVLGVFPHQLRSSWDRLVFSGTGQAPTQVRNEEEMLDRIENTPGAIGYITRSHEHGQVKELPVIKD
jgi:ABC-type phosphate transport system substrate-binding protein